MQQTEFDAPAFLALLRQGDEAAYRRLVRRFHGSLVGVATSMIGSRAQAEEVVQDSWLAVYAGIGRFEGRSSLVTWLFSIVLNRARTRASREGRTVGLSALMDGSPPGERTLPVGAFLPDGHWIEEPRLWDEVNPERIVGGRQLFDHAMDCIERLPAGQKAVIILRDLEGRAAEEACALLDISPENQRVLLHRARGRVRQTLDALVGAAPVGSSTARRERADAKRRPPGVARLVASLRPTAWLDKLTGFARLRRNRLSRAGVTAVPESHSVAVDSSGRPFDHRTRYAPAFFW